MHGENKCKIVKCVLGGNGVNSEMRIIKLKVVNLSISFNFHVIALSVPLTEI